MIHCSRVWIFSRTWVISRFLYTNINMHLVTWEFKTWPNLEVGDP